MERFVHRANVHGVIALGPHVMDSVALYVGGDQRAVVVVKRDLPGRGAVFLAKDGKTTVESNDVSRRALLVIPVNALPGGAAVETGQRAAGVELEDEGTDRRGCRRLTRRANPVVDLGGQHIAAIAQRRQHTWRQLEFHQLDGRAGNAAEVLTRVIAANQGLRSRCKAGSAAVVVEDRDGLLLVGTVAHRLVGDREITAIRAALRRNGDAGAWRRQRVAGLQVTAVVVDRVVDAKVSPAKGIHLRPGHDEAAVSQRLDLRIQHGVASGNADVQGLDDVVACVQHPDDAVVQRAGRIPGDIVTAGLPHVLDDRVTVTQLLQADVDSHLGGGVGGAARDHRDAIKVVAWRDLNGNGLAAVVARRIGGGHDQVIAAGDGGAVQRDDTGGGINVEPGEAVLVQAVDDGVGVAGIGVVHLGARRCTAGEAGAVSRCATGDDGRSVIHCHATAGDSGDIAGGIHGIRVVSPFGQAVQGQHGADVSRDGNAVHQVVGSIVEAVQIRHRHAVADQVYRARLGALHDDHLTTVLHAVRVADEHDARRRGIDDVVGDGLRGLIAGGIGGGDNELRTAGLVRAGNQCHHAGAGVNAEVLGVVQAVGDAVRVGGGSGIHGIASDGAVGNVGGCGRAGKDRHGVIHHHAAAGNDRKIACRIDSPGVIGAVSKVGSGDRCTGICDHGRAGPLVAGGASNVAELTDHDIVVDQIDGAGFGALHGGLAVMVQYDQVVVSAAVGIKFLHVEAVTRNAAARAVTVPGHHVFTVCTDGSDLWIEVTRTAGSFQSHHIAYRDTAGIEFLHIDVPIRAANTHPGDGVATIPQRRDARELITVVTRTVVRCVQLHGSAHFAADSRELLYINLVIVVAVGVVVFHPGDGVAAVGQGCDIRIGIAATVISVA